jgi:predicted Rossmann fold nucleotide-binding protein DprA/Smf involved in DNA uptake
LQNVVLSYALGALYAVGENRSWQRPQRAHQLVETLQRILNSPKISSIMDELLLAKNESDPNWEALGEILHREGFGQFAIKIADHRRLGQAMRLVDEGSILTLACPSYPEALRKNLGIKAPPIIWLSSPNLRDCPPWQTKLSLFLAENSDALGQSNTSTLSTLSTSNPASINPLVGIGAIGCRKAALEAIWSAEQTAQWAADHGYFCVTGGAIGCDSAFARVANALGAAVINVLPHGIHVSEKNYVGEAISVCAPGEAFSTYRAMERNQIIYALSDLTVVCSSRYRVGGSWSGATEALRQHQPIALSLWGNAEDVVHKVNDVVNSPIGRVLQRNLSVGMSGSVSKHSQNNSRLINASASKRLVMMSAAQAPPSYGPMDSVSDHGTVHQTSHQTALNHHDRHQNGTKSHGLPSELSNYEISNKIEPISINHVIEPSLDHVVAQRALRNLGAFVINIVQPMIEMRGFLPNMVASLGADINTLHNVPDGSIKENTDHLIKTFHGGLDDALTWAIAKRKGVITDGLFAPKTNDQQVA